MVGLALVVVAVIVLVDAEQLARVVVVTHVLADVAEAVINQAVP